MAECNLFNKSDGAVPPSCWLVRQLSEAPRVQNAWKPTELTDKRQGPENTTIYIIFTVGFPKKKHRAQQQLNTMITTPKQNLPLCFSKEQVFWD